MFVKRAKIELFDLYCHHKEFIILVYMFNLKVDLGQ